MIYNPKPKWGVNPATGEKVNLSETTKLKKARELKAKGNNIEIITGNDFLEI